MRLTPEEERIRDEAIAYIDDHRDELIQRFITDKRPLPLGFTTIFMAGSPGSGKTEFSERYMPYLRASQDAKVTEALEMAGIPSSSYDSLLIHLDVDKIRAFLPQYVRSDSHTDAKANAHVIQKAATRGLDILRSYCFEHDVSFLHDGTFGNYATMRELIRRSVRDGREVHIYYLYIDPIAAWSFTKAREYLEGRNILKEKFIEQFMNSRDNVDRAKSEFGDAVKIHCILKDDRNHIIDIAFNQPSVNQFLDTKRGEGLVRDFTYQELADLLE